MKNTTLSMKKIFVLIVSLITLIVLLFVAGLANPTIELEDPNLEKAVREKLDRPTGPIYQTDLNTITNLDASNREITSLKGLERFSKLVDLNLESNNIEDWSPLEDLFMLNNLNLSNNDITDIEFIKDINNLVYLNLDNNNIEDLNPLSDKITLEEMSLVNNRITNLNGLEDLYTLTSLDLKDNRINDLTPLKDIDSLVSLNLRNNRITSLEEINFNEVIHLPIENLSLRHNVADGERLSDINLLGEMTSLVELELRDNHIEDISPISSLVNLKVLDLRENRFKDLEDIGGLTQLVELNIRENDINSIEPLSNLTNLEYLNLHSNTDIKSLEPIRNLVNLNTLIVRYVPLEDEFDVISNLTNLQNLNALDTGIENIDVKDLVSSLRSIGALQEDVRPVTLIHTVEAPTFSHVGGFYEGSFTLQMDSRENNGRIFYTLDGSQPTENSFRYMDINPIVIDNGDKDNAAVVRARIIKEDGNVSETITNTYFVNKDIKDRFTLPVISIATDEANLFDEDIGIYNGENAFNRGSDWERPIHIEFFEKDGTRRLQQNAGIRIHGGATRGHEHKSFRLYADREYDKTETFQYEIFEGLEKKNSNEPIDEFKTLLLRTSGDDWSLTMFRDAMMQKLVEPLDTMDTQAYQPSVIFINGEYWGIRNIRERYDEYYLENTYGVPKDQVVILTGSQAVNVGDTSDSQHYREMIHYIEANGLIENSNYEYIKTLMDVENFIDYFVAQTYFGNHDWPQNNIQYWRLNTDEYVENAPFGHDGRWRWMIFDTDAGFGWAYRSKDRHGNIRDYSHNTIQWVMTEFDGRFGRSVWPNFLIRSLMENENFKIDFINRYADLLNSNFLPEDVIGHINNMQRVIEPEMEKHVERFDAIGSMDDWHRNMDVMRTFGERRPHYIREHIMEEFNIEDTINMNIKSYPEKGYIVINTLEVKNDWQGIYFKGIPITVTAVEHPGYEFSHWEGWGVLSTEKSVEIVPNEDIELKAVFRPIS